MQRGDVILVRFPHPSVQRGKMRPAVVAEKAEGTPFLRSMIASAMCSVEEGGTIRETGPFKDSGLQACLLKRAERFA